MVSQATLSVGIRLMESINLSSDDDDDEVEYIAIDVPPAKAPNKQKKEEQKPKRVRSHSEESPGYWSNSRSQAGELGSEIKSELIPETSASSDESRARRRGKRRKRKLVTTSFVNDDKQSDDDEGVAQSSGALTSFTAQVNEVSSVSDGLAAKRSKENPKSSTCEDMEVEANTDI